MKGDSLVKKIKSLTMPKKTERGKGAFWDFSKSIPSQNPLGNIFFKSRTMPKKLKVVSPGIVCYVKKKEKTFLVQFSSKFCTFGRTTFVTSCVSKKNTDEKP